MALIIFTEAEDMDPILLQAAEAALAEPSMGFEGVITRCALNGLANVTALQARNAITVAAEKAMPLLAASANHDDAAPSIERQSGRTSRNGRGLDLSRGIA